MSVCAGCGESLPPTKPSAGRPRKWCSDRCRKDQYRPSCVDCGALLNGSDGLGPNRALRCRTCSKVEQRRMANRHRNAAGKEQVHTDDMLLDALRFAAQQLAEEGIDGPLVKSAYDYVQAGNNALPVSATIVNRFDYWADAVLYAGLQPGQPRRGSYTRQTREDCAAALRAAADDLGDIPTLNAYRAWRRTRPGAPSSELISIRFGGWLDALDCTFPQIQEKAA